MVRLMPSAIPAATAAVPAPGTDAATVADETQDLGYLPSIVCPNLPTSLVRAVDTFPISCQTRDLGNQFAKDHFYFEFGYPLRSGLI